MTIRYKFDDDDAAAIARVVAARRRARLDEVDDIFGPEFDKSTKYVGRVAVAILALSAGAALATIGVSIWAVAELIQWVVAK